MVKTRPGSWSYLFWCDSRNIGPVRTLEALELVIILGWNGCSERAPLLREGDILGKESFREPLLMILPYLIRRRLLRSVLVVSFHPPS